MNTTNLNQHLKQTPETQFSDLYDEISRNWEEKSLALQARRWKKLSNSYTREDRDLS